MDAPISSRPLQNRVDPFGSLSAVPERGTLLGNRGVLHNEKKQIVAHWDRRAWITCLLSFKGRKRQVFSFGNYSELFFLDEATAFAAGHRPCGECRRTRYKEFKSAWVLANRNLVCSSDPPMGEIDRVLHAQRIHADDTKVTFETPFGELPAGTFVELGGRPYLLWHGHLLLWSFSGYEISRERPSEADLVRVLTPVSIVETFKRGFRPSAHISDA